MRNAQDRAKGNISALFPGAKIPPGLSFVGKCCFVDTETEFGVGGINLFGLNFSLETNKQIKMSRVDGNEVLFYYS